MILYLAVVLFPLLIGGIYQQNTAKVMINTEPVINATQNKRFFWLLFAALPMFLLIALRGWRMGADTGIYQDAFLRIANTPWNQLTERTKMEYGYLVFNKLISFVTRRALGFQIIYTAIYMITIVNFANQLEDGNFLFLYLFGTLNLYMFMFTGVRQCLAMCICLWSYKYIKERKVIPVILIIALASTFHKSAVIFILVYIIYSNRINALNSLFYVIGSFIAYLNIELIQEWFNDNLGYDYGVEETGNGVIFLFVMLAITVFSMSAIFKAGKPNKRTQGLININFLTVICWILRLATRIAERPSYYFMFFSVAMLCVGVYSIKESKERMQIKLFVLVATLILFIYRLSTNFSSLIPYQTFS